MLVLSRTLAACSAYQALGTAVGCAVRRFEELAYADAATYMEDGRALFTGSTEEVRTRLRLMGASV